MLTVSLPQSLPPQRMAVASRTPRTDHALRMVLGSFADLGIDPRVDFCEYDMRVRMASWLIDREKSVGDSGHLGLCDSNRSGAC